MPETTRYTVVIPSRNRQTYCVEAVQSVLNCSRDDVQIIVVDNSEDQDKMGALLEQHDLMDSVDYLPSTGESLQMNDNWERSLEHVLGEWLMFIGDDDGLMPSAFETLDFFIDRTPIMAYRWSTANYKWPCFPTSNRGLLNYPNKPLQIMLNDTKVELQANAQWSVGASGLWPKLGPSVYHGAVNMRIIQALKEKYGRYFYNNVTDYTSAVLNMTQLNIYLSFTDPLTIMGASGPSNTASMAGTKAGKPDEERKHCFQYESDDYAEFKGSHLMVPYVAARYRELFELLEVPFNLTPQKLLASCVAEFRKLRDEGQYETEREILIRYAESYQLKEMAQQIGQMKRKETKYYVGNVDQEGAVFVDTIKLGIRGIADLSKQMDAFCLNAQNHQASYENTCQQILAHLRSQEASALA